MRTLYFFILFSIFLLTSCRNDFAFEQSSGGLTFSKSTVYLDTIFSNVSSSTYRLKVYNKSNKDISIPQIRLQKGMNSKFRLMVDGIAGNGKIFNNIEMLANDSLFIFIEATADIASANPTDFLYTDKIEFTNTNSTPQTVDLVTLIQDAYFIYPEKNASNQFETINLGVDANNVPLVFRGSNLSRTDPINGDELHMTKTKPYVIYSYALVPNNETLIIDKGAKVYFHVNSGLIIPRTGTIKVNGDNPPSTNLLSLENEVTFEGDRLEPTFENTPGQWGAIINYSETNNNLINHLTLKNATVGIINQPRLVLTDNYSPKMTINNSKFFNCSNIGILSRNAQVDGKNIVINNCGEVSLACTFGGNYTFTQCTFNNSFNSTKQVALLLNNFLKDTPNTFIPKPLNNANFNNCIVYGSNQVEISLDKKDASLFNFNFTNCLLKFNNSSLGGTALYDFTNTTYYVNPYIASNSTVFNPKFVNVSKNKFSLSEQWTNLMPASTLFNFNDINGKPRVAPIALGAFQYYP